MNDGAGLRIPSLSGFSSAHGEGTESRKLEPFFFFNRSANGFKCCIHRKLCGFLAKLSYFSHLLHQIAFRHNPLPPFVYLSKLEKTTSVFIPEKNKPSARKMM